MKGNQNNLYLIGHPVLQRNILQPYSDVDFKKKL